MPLKPPVSGASSVKPKLSTESAIDFHKLPERSAFTCSAIHIAWAA